MKVKLNDKEIVVEFELNERRPSSTGRSLIRFTTGGFIPIPNSSLLISMTVIEKRGRGSIMVEE